MREIKVQPLLLCGNKNCEKSRTCLRYNADPIKLQESRISVSPNLCQTDQFELYAETEFTLKAAMKVFGSAAKKVSL